MDKQLTSINCMGYPVFTGSLDFLPSQGKVVVNTINQYSYCMAERDADFKKSLLESDILLPDGIGIVAASKLLNGKKIVKVAGADIHKYLLQELNRIGGSCFYLGSSEETLNKIKERLAIDFPSLKVASYSPPFRPVFSEKENSEMVAAVNNFKPDVLFVGMTAPKQEKWAHAHKELLETRIICSIGAVFDFYAGTVERPAEIWIKLGLEWLARLLKEPKRMWRRYIYFGPVFVYLVLKERSKYWVDSPQ